MNVSALLSALSCAAVVLAFAQSGYAQTDAPSADGDGSCAMQSADAAWFESSVAAWTMVRERNLRLAPSPSPQMLVFDAACVWSFAPGGADAGVAGGQGRPYDGLIALPYGGEVPPVVLSFAAPRPKGDGAFFVMSLPSVWRAQGVDSPMGLETLMTGVFIHEIAHTEHFSGFGARLAEQEEKWGFGDSLSDDAVQEHFENDADYVAHYEAELALLYEAAGASDDDGARIAARRAKAAIDERRARWLVGENEKYREIEDIFLAMEGAANWAAIQWLSDVDGGGAAPDVALSEMAHRADKWSQDEGAALFLVIDRLVDDWQARAFGEGALTAFELLAIAAE